MRFKAVEFDRNVQETGNVYFSTEVKNVEQAVQGFKKFFEQRETVEIGPSGLCLYRNDLTWAVVPTTYKAFEMIRDGMEYRTEIEEN